MSESSKQSALRGIASRVAELVLTASRAGRLTRYF